VLFDYGAPGKSIATRVVVAREGKPAVRDRPIRIGFIGAGNFAKSTLIPAFKNSGGSTLSAVVTS
jgi:hypothetical protein